MTPEEIHDFGIEVVAEYMTREGYTVKKIQPFLATIPSIIAEKDKKTFAVLVRNDVYPNKGELSDSDKQRMLAYAKENKAIPMFAQVGIANANGKTDEEMAVATRGTGFYVAFEGMKEIQDLGLRT